MAFASKVGSMDIHVIGMLAETFIHPGTGQSEGAVDLRVAREAATDYPVIPGSGCKGAWRDFARAIWPAPETPDGKEEDDSDQVRCLFGKPEGAGEILFGDARILLLPFRSLSGSYRWVTCPHLIERWERDRCRAGLGTEAFFRWSPETRLTAGDDLDRPHAFSVEASGPLFLEERLFEVKGAVPDVLIERLTPAIVHGPTRDRLADQLTIVSDNQFAALARLGLSITAHNSLDKDTKSSKALWYEEALPPDTVMYTLLSQRRSQGSALAELTNTLAEHRYLQLGGNETVGQGWFKVAKLGGSRPGDGR